MEMRAASDSVERLAALAHGARLALFRLLVQAGPEGLPAGEIGRQLGRPPNSVSFHLARLRHAGLITSERKGRSIVYAASYETIRGLVDYLTENCCGRSAEGCPPACRPEDSNDNRRS
ncbi:MAG: helix-turn-helix transcriptional regulator [Candidatus Tectomicrobia bacterium]|uniref:Helix-turn-helix transcriptional regulator n=1 Tax=Tectimicrobiota bacterium TaxID=2528274 RepID=A0A932I213_UNCTE|nr:helix-turn-helix transcriptional regulator [Candidatus Tectomicrobia bacterium]